MKISILLHLICLLAVGVHAEDEVVSVHSTIDVDNAFLVLRLYDDVMNVHQLTLMNYFDSPIAKKGQHT